MAEAVFSITADITPQINERELERQANAIANQLNGILAKQVTKVGVKAESGNFRPFQAELEKSRGLIDKLQEGARGLPRALGNVARAGRSNFLKFTDAINVTRREFVGFGKGIRETIEDTNLFEKALDGIRATGATIGELPKNFQEMAAQVRSGTSYIDQMAEQGDKMAKLFQPLQAQGEGARTEFVELNRSIDQLIGAVQALGTASRKTGSVVSDQFGIPLFDQQIKSMEELKTIVASSPVLLNRLQGSIREAFNSGNLTGIHTELQQIITETEKMTGPVGRFKQEINALSGGKFFKGFTEEARELNDELRKGAIDKLRELGGNELLGPFQNLASAFRTIKENVIGAVNVLNGLRTTLATLLPGQSPLSILVENIAEGVTHFQTLRSVGVSSLDAIGSAIGTTYDKFKSDIVSRNQGFFDFLERAKQEVVGLGLSIVQTKLGSKINDSLGSAGNFLNKNLIEPLRAGRGQIRQAFSEIGRDFSNGLGTGISAAKPTAVQEARKLADSSLKALREKLKSHSDSKETYKTGVDTGMGYAHGVESTKGRVNSAIAALGGGLSALASQVGQFARSVGLVAGTAFAGLGASALLAGKEFNVLKQVVNATVPVLVGSKEAAKELLDQVNLLNDKSPFARSSFLELTRVLAGFGVQAQKITPLIDAIQQTVAATGGSDQDLLELGQAFAKIQSQGRVTGEILQSFSVRGVDAVAVLAKGFKVTTTEMRGMISDGLVPANKAIDVLTKGLKEKFDGATEAVAKNFPGALQRVQARLRDIGGTLLTAFITPSGGGALVDFLNNMADSLGYINKTLLPEMAPLLQTAANALVVVSEKVENFVKALSAKEFKGFIEDLKPWAPLLAGLAGLIPAAFGFIPVIGPMIAGLGGPFVAVGAAIAVFLAQSGKLGDVFKGVTGSAKEVEQTTGSAFSSITEHTGGLIAAFTGGAAGVQKFIGLISGTALATTKSIPVVSKLGTVFAGLGGFVSKIVGVFGNLLPVTTKLLGHFPKMAGAVSKLSGPFGWVVSIFVTLITTSKRFRDSLLGLWEAIKPVAQVIMGVFAVAIKILDEAIKALEPVFTLIVLALTKFFEAMKPVVEKVKEFLGWLDKNDVIEKFFGTIKSAISTAVDVVITGINWLIKAYNAIPFLDNVAEIKFEIDADTDPLKKAANDAKKAHEEMAKASKASADAVEDNYNKATKAVETSTKALEDSTSLYRQAIDSAAGAINGFISAAKSVQTAVAAVAEARAKHTQATNDLAQLEKDRAKALADTISPANELGVAERNLTRIRQGLTDLTREATRLGKDNANLLKENTKIELENAKIAKETADLLGEKGATDRAALARSEERAQIALNRAKQAELDLLDELNGKEKVSLNLAGLSIDQIKAKLAAARLSAKSSGREREKTPQEIADMKRSARLDVEDAEQASKDATQARADFEIELQEKVIANNEAIIANNEKINDNKEQILLNDERIKAIADDRLDQLLDEQEAIKEIGRLRAGEHTLQKTTLEWDEKIRDQKDLQKKAADDINTATHNAAVEQATFRLKTMEARGDADGILKAHQDLWALQTQGQGLNFAAGELRDITKKQMENVQNARDAAREMKDELIKANKQLAAATALTGATSGLTSFENIGHSIENASARQDDAAMIKLIPKQNQAKDSLYAALRGALAAGAAEQKNKGQEPWFPNAGQIEAVIRKIEEIFGRIRNLRDAVAQGLNAFNLSMPGFAAAHGYAPGDYIQGMNNGVGLMRWAEFGKEAILPLTRKMDMARVVNNPQVLPAILDALPRWAMPANELKANEADLNALAKRERGVRSNAEVYDKKNQREFADQIGQAVYTAVKMAIAESETRGADVDINVMPSSANEILIARQVKREVEKAMGKRW